MRVALAGSGRLGVGVLRALADLPDCEVAALLQDGRRARGAYRKWIPAFARPLRGAYSVTGWARHLDIPVHWIDTMSPEELAPLRDLGLDLILVSGFGVIFKPPLLDLPRIGCVNVHSSLLPRHRGPNPFHAALLSGDAETGVTFHVMEPGIDSGPILAQYAFPLKDDDTMLSVYERCCEVAAERVPEVLAQIRRAGLRGTPQDSALATYDPKPQTADAWLHWNEPAEELDRIVRAFTPSPMARFALGRQVVFVARSRVVPAPAGAAPGVVLSNRAPVRVATGDGALEIQAAFVRWPIPWYWPEPWRRPAVGARLESE